MKNPDTLPKGITIYCGSGTGNDPAFAEAARAVGRAVADTGLPLIYGGGRMGMMYAAAAACRDAGGETLSVIPGFMVERLWDDKESTYTIVTPDMHTRKQTFAARCKGAIAMPGGIGTFEELTELITWRQLGLFVGNIVILNINGYYDDLLAQLDAAIKAGFMPADHCRLWEVTDDAAHAVSLATRDNAGLTLNRKF
ncbi:MAG: TIGR00730 family Rossman fold protein [Bacteroidales bacterium]|nr:TIGR00730 family Rossman fold protein [Bacteroidales bacterium]